MSEIIRELTGVPRTLLLPLRGRAEAQADPYPLFQDPVAVKWFKLVGWDKELDRLYSKSSQASRIVAAIRTYHHDQIASAHIAKYSHPIVVELGAGLSSRFHRIGQNTHFWFELDLPVVTELRHKLDTQTQQHQFISASVLDFDWMDTLPKVAPENILFIAEGLLMYLDINDVQQLISVMRSRFPGATLDMEVVGHSAKISNQIFTEIGAPLKWFINNEEDLRDMGLQVVNSWSMYQLYQERWPLHWKSFLRFMTQFPYFRNTYLIVETKL